MEGCQSNVEKLITDFNAIKIDYEKFKQVQTNDHYQMVKDSHTTQEV